MQISEENHLFGAGLWVGRRNSDGKKTVISPRLEFQSGPSWKPSEPILITTDQSDLDVTSRYFSESPSGRIDVTQVLHHWDDQPFMIADFTISLTNPTRSIENVSVGFGADFDLNDLTHNVGGFLEESGTSFVSSQEDIATIALLTDFPTGHVQWSIDDAPQERSLEYNFVSADGVIHFSGEMQSDISVLQNAGEFDAKSEHIAIQVAYVLFVTDSTNDIDELIEDAQAAWRDIEKPNDALIALSSDSHYVSPDEMLEIPIQLDTDESNISEIHITFDNSDSFLALNGVSTMFHDFVTTFVNGEQEFGISMYNLEGQVFPMGSHPAMVLECAISDDAMLGDVFHLESLHCLVIDEMGGTVSHTTEFGKIFVGIDGDANFDGNLNVLDIVVISQLILEFGGAIPHDEYWTADATKDNILNILDIVYLVSEISGDQ